MSDAMTWGVAIAILGMTGTMVTLGVIGLLVDLLKRIFPYTPEGGA